MKSIFDRLKSFGLASAPCHVVTSGLPAGGLGIQALPLQSEEDITNQYFIVGEFVGEANKFPTPYKSHRVFERDSDLLFNDYSVREGHTGLRLAGMCNNSLVFPNAFKVPIYDSDENKKHFFLVSTGRVINSNQELLWLDTKNQCRDSDFIPPWSVMNVQDNISSADMDNIIFFLKHQDLQTPIQQKLFGHSGALSNPISMDDRIINKIDQCVSGQSHWFMVQLMSQNFAIYQYCMRCEELKDCHGIIKKYRDIGLQTIGCQPYLQSSAVRESSSTPGLSRSLTPVDFLPHLRKEKEILSEILKDNRMKTALQAQNWQLILTHNMWVESLRVPDKFDFCRQRDRMLTTKLDGVYRYCYRFLSFKGDTTHYLKAMLFMQSLSFMVSEVQLAADGRYPLEMFSPKLLGVIRRLKEVISFGLKENHSQQKSLLMAQLQPNIRTYTQQLKASDYNKYLEFISMVEGGDPVSLYNYLVDLFIDRIAGEIDSIGSLSISQHTNGSFTSVSSGSLTHSGVDAFYDELTCRLAPYTQCFMDVQCLSALNNWRSPERMLFMKTLFHEFSLQCSPSRLEDSFSACQGTMFSGLAASEMTDAASCGLKIGATVTLFGLKNAEYNGKEGTICGYSKDRVVVCMDEDQSKKTIRPINLALKPENAQSADLSAESKSGPK